MGTMEKDKKGPLYQLAADLFLRSKGGEESSSSISRLSEEIKKEISSNDEIFGKFQGLLESFRDIIPEEKQRYQAALKALLCTSGLSQKDVLKAIDSQLAELKKLEKGFMSTLPNWRDQLKAMESKLREIRNEISRLREKIMQLEREEQEILDGMTSREEERKSAERGVENVLADIAAEITAIREKIEEFAGEKVLSHPITPPDSITSHKTPTGKNLSDRKSHLRRVSEPEDTKREKKCPMCGRQVKWYEKENMWRCFACAYEEMENMEVPVL